MSQIIYGDALESLRQISSDSVDVCVTSPPYYNLRDYGVDGQIGLEDTPEDYISRLVDVFREVKRVLKPDGTCWINIADSYAGSGKGRKKDGNISLLSEKQLSNAGSAIGKLKKTISQDCKPKDLIGIPWMLAFALRADGWYLRDDIIWAKPNPMPESVRDRCTKSYEHIFMLSKSPHYYFDAEAIAEPVADSTITRLNSDIENQNGSYAYGKTNGNVKAVPPRFGGSKYSKEGDVHNRTKSGNVYKVKPLRNKRNVWTVTTKPYKGAHFATFPHDLIEPCILAGSPLGGTVLDPFLGSGTTAATAFELGREYIGIELNKDYEPLIKERLRNANHQINILDEPEYLKGACL